MLAAAIDVEPGTFLAVMAASAVGGTAAALRTGRGLLVPTAVVELLRRRGDLARRPPEAEPAPA